MRQATASYSRLVREMVVKESPVTEVSVMATKDSRPVREEYKVSVGSPKEPVVFRGRSRSREVEWPMSPNLVEMWSSHRGGGITGSLCPDVACGSGN